MPELDLEKYPTPLFLVTVLQCFLRFGDEAIAEHCLSLDQLFDNWLELIVLMRRDGCRTADDERSPRFVDQNGINLVDDGKVMATLNLLVLRSRHPVITQIVESEFTIRAIADITIVLRLAVRWRLIVLDTTNR